MLPILLPPKKNTRLSSILEKYKANVLKHGDQSFAPSLKKIRDALTAMLHSNESKDKPNEDEIEEQQHPKSQEEAKTT